MRVVDKDFVFAAVADERRRIAVLIDGLDDAQLATASLCTGWDVKTVAAHLVSVFADGFWGVPGGGRTPRWHPPWDRRAGAASRAVVGGGYR